MYLESSILHRFNRHTSSSLPESLTLSLEHPAVLFSGVLADLHLPRLQIVTLGEAEELKRRITGPLNLSGLKPHARFAMLVGITEVASNLNFTRR
jgi:hypothetical protein